MVRIFEERSKASGRLSDHLEELSLQAMLESFMSAWHTLKVISEEGTSIKKNASIGHAQVCRAFSLQATDVGGPSPLWVRDLPGLVVLGLVRKQAEQVSNLHSSMASATAPAYRLLTCLSSYPDLLGWWRLIGKHMMNKPFPLQVALVIVFHHSNSNPN